LAGAQVRRRPVRGIADITQTLREIRGIPVIATMVLLAGAVSFFVGNSYQAQMPGFAQDLGHGDPGVAYTSLLAADAAGALLGGLVLESRGRLFSATSRTALRLAVCWALALLGFALAGRYLLAVPLLFLAGFFELSFSSLAQALVQMNAPDEIRGRVLGLFNMASAGLRTFSGITVGLAGSLAGIHTSLALSTGGVLAVASLLELRLRRP
jgi:MFS family permease